MVGYCSGLSYLKLIDIASIDCLQSTTAGIAIASINKSEKESEKLIKNNINYFAKYMDIMWNDR